DEILAQVLLESLAMLREFLAFDAVQCGDKTVSIRHLSTECLSVFRELVEEFAHVYGHLITRLCRATLLAVYSYLQFLTNLVSHRVAVTDGRRGEVGQHIIERWRRNAVLVRGGPPQFLLARRGGFR